MYNWLIKSTDGKIVMIFTLFYISSNVNLKDEFSSGRGGGAGILWLPCILIVLTSITALLR